jgi:succinoglycan biosynthesis protein ExoM
LVTVSILNSDDTLNASVVICTYQRPALLARCLRSVLLQHVPDGCRFEIVVVDNSGDGNAEPVVAGCADGAAVPLRYVGDPRPNISRARNAGVAAARGRWIAFLDDDEEAGPGWLAALLASGETTGADIVFGPVEPVFETAPPAWDPEGASFYHRLDLPDGAEAPVHGEFGHARRLGKVGTCNVLIRREVFDGDPEPFDPAFGRSGGEDSDFFRRQTRAGRRIVWAARARATEWVPAERTTLEFMARRRFRDSQTHVRLLLKNSGRPWFVAVVLMARGALQAGLWGPVRALGASLPEPLAARARFGWTAGTGKLFWWRGLRRGDPAYN